MAALTLLPVFCSGVPAEAAVRLPAVFNHHMVLQRDMPVPIWGWAEPGENVRVTFAGQTKSAVTGKDGRWMIRLDALPASAEPAALVVKGSNTLRLNDVLVGEVWVASGQSNMAMTVARCKNFEQEKAAAQFPGIRMFTVARKTAPEPQTDCAGKWAVCSPQTVGGFSATAYFFARPLHQKLKVPVGILHTSWGGTPVEAWTSLEAQKAVPALAPVLEKWRKLIATYDEAKTQQAYQKRLARWQAAAKKARAAGRKAPRRPRRPVNPATGPHRPANLFNAMIAPLIPYAIRGAIWYQGEHNAGREFPHLYRIQLPTLIRDWRRRWGEGDFTFLFVQLPNFRAPQKEPVEPSGWVTVRDAMLQTLAVPHTGMAITVDIGEARDIHPKNKQDVGRRLALWALGTTYGKKLVYSGPLFKTATFTDGKVRLTFSHAGKGLQTRDGQDVKGFAIAGEDRKFHFARAKIDGDSVIVWSDAVKKPVAVRYSWAANPQGNLYNSAGLPASPFRTDNWKDGGR